MENKEKLLTLSPRLIMNKGVNGNIKLENHTIQNIGNYILL